MKISKLFCAGLLVAITVSGALAASSWHTTPFFHSTTPAGYDVLAIKPGDAIVSFLALIECPELEGAQAVGEGTAAKIINADGQPLTTFPEHFSFRVTASLRKTVLLDPTATISTDQTPQNLLLKLKFQLKAYHGLQARVIEPESVQMIGVPADVPYDERVYRINFALDKLPITDRCVLEVLSPTGERLTKFHFDLL
jgi:hypothetical protein